MDAPYTLSTDVFGGGGYVSVKNMLSQIVFYRHISPSCYTVSAEVGVARKSCRKSVLCLTYPSFLNVVSAEVGVARKAVANCFYVLHIPPFQM